MEEKVKQEWSVRTLADMSQYCFDNSLHYTVYTHLGVIAAKFFGWVQVRKFIIFVTNDHYNDWEIITIEDNEVKIGQHNHGS